MVSSMTCLALLRGATLNGAHWSNFLVMHAKYLVDEVPLTVQSTESRLQWRKTLITLLINNDICMITLQ